LTKTFHFPASPPVENSLRRQTLLAVVLVFLGVIAVVVTIFFLYINFVEEAYWQNRQLESASAVSKVVTDFLVRTQDFINVIDVIENDDEHFAEVFAEIFPLNATLDEVIIVDEGTIQYTASKDTPILANELTVQQSNWYIEALENGRYMSNVQSTDAGDLYVILSQRASTGGDVIAARLLMSVVNEELESIQFGTTGDAYVIDFDGRVIAHADDKEEEYPETIADRAEFTNIINAPANQWHGEYVNAQDETVLGTSMNIPGTPWILVSETETDEAFALSTNASRLLTLFVVLAAIIVVVAARG
jgi:hypothetical protein